jgi:integrase
MDYSKVDSELDRVNASPKRLAGLPVAIERVGGSLYCRAMFPPKPGESKPKQRRIPIGRKATVENLFEAVEWCRSVGAELISGTWSWPEIEGEIAKPITTKDFVEQHRRNYIDRNLTPGKDRGDTLKHWDKDFGYVFKHLNQSSTPTIRECLELAKTTPPHTRKRQRYVKALSQLLKLANLNPSDLTPLAGKYKPSAANPRDIPDAETIIKWGQRMPERWRFFYFLLASFGIRGTEAHPQRCDVSDLIEHKEIKVWAGKSQAWRFVPTCSDQIFDALICKQAYPNGNQTPAKLSADFGQILQAVGCPFTPYALRHFWAFETLRQGWDTAWSAKCMGHSVKLHQEVYWMGIDARMSREILANLRGKTKPL